MRPLVVLAATLILAAGCGGQSASPTPSGGVMGATATPLQTPAPVSPTQPPTYPELTLPPSSGSFGSESGQPIFETQGFTVGCSGDTCHFSGDMTNTSPWNAVSGKLTVTAEAVPSGPVLAGCETVVRFSQAGQTVHASCDFDRSSLAGRPNGSVAIEYGLGQVAHGL